MDADALARMKPGGMLVNTSRGGLVETPAVIEALKTGHLGALALDVYEEEAELFFEDLSQRIITDDVFTRLLTFPNVLVTSHQAFLTREALEHIAATTVANLTGSSAATARATGCPRPQPPADHAWRPGPGEAWPDGHADVERPLWPARWSCSSRRRRRHSGPGAAAEAAVAYVGIDVAPQA